MSKSMTATRDILTGPIFANNPVAMQVLGVC